MNSTKVSADHPVTFIEKAVTRNPPRCVDGRFSHKSPQGPQMLGGSAHPIVLNSIVGDMDLNENTVIKVLKALERSGFETGIHYGHHRNPELGTTDCGFGDKLKEILTVAKDPVVVQRVEQVYEREGLDGSSLRLSHKTIIDYNLNRIAFGMTSEIVTCCHRNGAAMEELEGDHKEQVAFVNLKPGTTLDTKSLNAKGAQAFNLDLWYALSEGSAVFKEISWVTLRDVSLILYMSTEIVLVEQKGGPALDVVLRK